MVTKNEYLKALQVISKYKQQIFSEQQETIKSLNAIGLPVDDININTLLNSVNISVRCLNALKVYVSDKLPHLKYNYNYCNVRIGDLEGIRKIDLIKSRNLGKKSVKEIEDLLFSVGIILK